MLLFVREVSWNDCAGDFGALKVVCVCVRVIYQPKRAYTGNNNALRYHCVQRAGQGSGTPCWDRYIVWGSLRPAPRQNVSSRGPRFPSMVRFQSFASVVDVLIRSSVIMRLFCSEQGAHNNHQQVFLSPCLVMLVNFSCVECQSKCWGVKDLLRHA